MQSTAACWRGECNTALHKRRARRGGRKGVCRRGQEKKTSSCKLHDDIDSNVVDGANGTNEESLERSGTDVLLCHRHEAKAKLAFKARKKCQWREMTSSKRRRWNSKILRSKTALISSFFCLLQVPTANLGRAFIRLCL